MLLLGDDCTFEGERLADRLLYYLGTNRSEASFASQGGGRVLLIGGQPFPENVR